VPPRAKKKISDKIAPGILRDKIKQRKARRQKGVVGRSAEVDEKKSHL